MGIEQQVRRYILENFLYTDDESELDSDQSLLALGVIDSTGVLELVSFIEQAFGVSVADEELRPENLDSVTRITAFVTGKMPA